MAKVVSLTDARLRAEARRVQARGAELRAALELLVDLGLGDGEPAILRVGPAGGRTQDWCLVLSLLPRSLSKRFKAVAVTRRGRKRG